MDLVLEEQLLALFRLMKQRIQTVAERLSLTYPQLVALRLLKQGGTLTMSDLTDRVGVTRGAMTGLVDRLEQAGLVDRRPSLEDRRVTFLELTPHGCEVLNQAQGLWHEETQRWILKLDEAERAQVSLALGRLLEVGTPPPDA